MLRWFHRQKAQLTGRNTAATPASVIHEQLNEPRPLPMGRQAFHEWADRIIAGALVPADAIGQKFALAEMIMHMKPTESHCADAYFIHCLRKAAANQVAHTIMTELHHERKAALEKQEAEAKEAKLKVVPPDDAEAISQK